MIQKTCLSEYQRRPRYYDNISEIEQDREGKSHEKLCGIGYESL